MSVYSDRDPTDQGVRYAGDPDADPVDYAALRAPEPPPAPPATAEHRARVCASTASRLGWSRSTGTSQLLAHCDVCGAAPRAWCRGRTGFLHPSRGVSSSTA